jgi:glycosyltransferase involved in cell wall biosynthesis
MKIVVISDWFAEQTGYAENCLPKALAALGHEVHLVTSNVQPYYNSSTYRQTYERFLGPPVVDCCIKRIDGYTLHRLPHREWRRRPHPGRLFSKLRQLKPQVVQTFDIHTPSTYIAVFGRIAGGYMLFLEAHDHASVFKSRPEEELTWKRRMLLWTCRNILGPVVSRFSERCYPISPDAAEIATHHHGIQESKILIESLGVDAEVFRPADSPEEFEGRAQLRKDLGIADGEIVCVYTGRFSADKNPLCLAKAVDRLVSEGHPFRGLFVGNGPQEPAIRALKGNVIHEFVPFKEVARFYHASEIGVWPRQESTSQLDAAACGLPLVLSDTITVRERVEGNGLLYREDNDEDLARKLLDLRDAAVRKRLGALGAVKVREHYSWDVIARRRIHDYEEALGRS